MPEATVKKVRYLKVASGAGLKNHRRLPFFQVCFSLAVLSHVGVFPSSFSLALAFRSFSLGRKKKERKKELLLFVGSLGVSSLVGQTTEIERESSRES